MATKKKKTTRKLKDKTWTDEDLAIAESLYMTYITPTEIAKETGIPRTTIVYHAQTYWRPKRELLKTEFMQAVYSGKVEAFTAITKGSMQIMTRALKHMTTRKQPPTLKEALDAAKLLDTIDKIGRLDEEASKEESNSRDQVNSEQLLQRLKQADPFFDMKKESEDEDETIN